MMHRLKAGFLACLAFAASANAGTTLNRMRDTHGIVIAHRVSSIPFSYLDAGGRPVGYAIDICMSVVGALRRELKLTRLDVEYLPITLATRLAAITDGKADMECGSTTNSAERRRQVGARLINDGIIQSIYDKWFARPIPPSGKNLNMPMGPLLRDLIRYPSDRFE